MVFRHRTGQFNLSQRTLVVGIVNVTPDSFSDGGRFPDADAAVAHAMELVAHGADVLDIGGESTRPGAQPVSAEEETARVVPVIRTIAKQASVPISVDTYKSSVATAAIAAGASIVNDISGLRIDPALAEVAARHQTGVILMHMQGTPQTMQTNPQYHDVIAEVREFLAERVAFAKSRGVESERIMIDPGIGFGKTFDHNLELLRGLTALKSLELPILVGTSRKSFIGKILDKDVTDRDWGTAATVAYAIVQGVHAVRVHNVKLCAEVAKMTDAVVRGLLSPAYLDPTHGSCRG